ncbi:type I polyketide synthase [Streptacidiphilus sp. P02-A3a]|uniref:type I polyketide synthase n=1 Tax=Streptacidiphilus sp. P02-A3a TaxID=2704468 RepID=UPI0015FCAE97|nr:type I polyketide synthase [Streptacidiphilus sp. P02-A3a]QMU67388.1 acyltransferase domain-containing protein [Streptacidiphilus sp. P02-A3a]
MTGIAVIGMSGRLPGAADLDEFWQNLLAGRDRITRTPVGGLRGTVADDLLDDARWIGASGRIPAPYDFDPAFFGMSPKEALTTDPQHRLLLTTVHRALEHAGVVPGAGPARVGVFAGVGRNRHEDLVRTVLADRGEAVNELALEMGNEKDHSTTKVAYRLGLTGPAVTVQSACSTGLVALHQASQSLYAQECDIAVAGAAALRVPDSHGYLYLEGGIGSADGVCRPFSARAGGAVAGDGVVAVVLKRLEDALADRDHVLAVVRGSAVNNDGAKSGYASVSARAQELVIRDALLFSETDPDTVGSVETHGSGTPLGDATEWSALARVYGAARQTWVGAVKSGIGHLREASGLAGLVRAVLSVQHGLVPPTINVGLPAEFVTQESTGLTLPRAALAWSEPGPRRAAVSAFGLGGTNAHVIVEEPPTRPAAEAPPGPALVLLSAHTPDALRRTADAWESAITTGRVTPAEAAEVSRSGRRHYRHRRFAVGTDPAALAARLGGAHPAPAAEPVGAPGVCFVFPGVGDQYPGMGAGLHHALPGYTELLRGYLDDCGEQIGRDLHGLLGSGTAAPTGTAAATGPRTGTVFNLRRLVEAGRGAPADEVFDPVASHAVLFSLQLALARSLQALGVRPTAVTGHSLGELAAATLAGVFTEHDALRIVVQRARAVARQPEGAMLAVSLSRAQAEELTGPGVWLAAVNSPRSCVLAGEREAVLAVVDQLNRRGLQGRLLPVRHAFHTPLLAAAGEELRGVLEPLRLSAPTIPIAANTTGAWARTELQDPDYWYRQLTSPVLFGEALATAAKDCDVLLEIGPGQLRTLAAQARTGGPDCAVVPTMRREYQNEPDAEVLLRALGQLWQHGCALDWDRLRGGARPARTVLPPTALDERYLFVAEGSGDLLAPRPATTAPVAPVAPAAPVVAAVAAPTGPVAGTRLEGVAAVLAELWEEILGVEAPTAEDDFFDLGGDSLMSVQLIFGIEERLGFHIPAIAVFQESGLGRMAAHIDTWHTTGGSE